jgi:glycosyltransferase involved in cell wall biosynthesis
MTDSDIGVAIVTTAHWEGDARLRRHVAYLGRCGISARIVSFANDGRFRATIRAMGEILTTPAPMVLLPDPELFAIGSLLARARRKKPILDIHEDYRKAASGRRWVPHGLTGPVAIAADWAVRLGRLTAWRVVVAAPELAGPEDRVVLNIPEPGSLPRRDAPDGFQLVYVGDVTLLRGAAEMAELIGLLDDRFELLIVGRIEPEARNVIEEIAARDGSEERISMIGRLEHEDAWRAAAGALVGLNLLQQVPAYREAVATKLWEYLAVGLPPVISDLPGQRHLVRSIDPDLVCASLQEAASVIRRLADDEDFRRTVVGAGYEVYKRSWDERRPDLTIQSALTP